METVIIVAYDMAKAQEVAKAIRSYHVYCKVVFHTEVETISEQPQLVVYVAQKNENINTSAFENVPAFVMDSGNLDYEQLKAFLFDENKIAQNWTMENIIPNMIQKIKDQIGDKKAILALSGGVDSSVCAILVSKAIGKNLTCVFVDNGMMRKNEGDEVEKMMSTQDLNFVRAEMADRFLGKLQGVIEPEAKRKIIGEEFIRVFEEEARKLTDATCLVQGTIYPDILESGAHSDLVKSHHNVGGLPEDMSFTVLVEPLNELFKDEVRELGLALGMSHEMVFRQPFPGPGLAVRCINEITKEKLDVLRDADFIFRDEVAKEGLSDSIWQYFAVMTDIRSTGMKNGKRSYGYVIALRAVHSVDAMHANIAELPYSLLTRTTERIISEVPDVGRVVYDITSKPPGTIEWE